MTHTLMELIEAIEARFAEPIADERILVLPIMGDGALVDPNDDSYEPIGYRRNYSVPFTDHETGEVTMRPVVVEVRLAD